MSSVVCEKIGNVVYVRDLRGNTVDTLSFQHEVSDASSFGNGIIVRAGGVCYSYELHNGHLKSTGLFASLTDERRACSAASFASNGSEFCGDGATKQLQRTFRKYQLWEQIKDAERDDREERILNALERAQAEKAKTRAENEQLKSRLTGLQRDLLDAQDDLLEVQTKQCKAEIARAKIDAWNFGRKYGITSGKGGHLCRPRMGMPYSFLKDLEQEVEESAIEGFNEGYEEGVKLCTLSDDEVSNIQQRDLEEERIIAARIREEERRERERERRERERKHELERRKLEAEERTCRAQERRKQSAEYRRRKAARAFLTNAFTVVGAIKMIIMLFQREKKQSPFLSVIGLLWRTCVYVFGLLVGMVVLQSCWSLDDEALKWGAIGLGVPLWLCASYYPICYRYGLTRSIGMAIQAFKSKKYKRCRQQLCALTAPMLWTVLIALGVWVLVSVIIPYGWKTTMWREVCEQHGLCTTFWFFVWVGVLCECEVWRYFNKDDDETDG